MSRLQREKQDRAQTLAELREDGFLALLARMLPARSAQLTRGIGDDCAILPLRAAGKRAGRAAVLTTDMLVEGTHFTRETIGAPGLLGRKAVSASVSDIAAMGAKPTVFVVGLATPPGASSKFLLQLYVGMRNAARLYECAIAGGDTVRAPALTLSIAMLGLLEGAAPAACRDGARPGHHVYVTGWPGESGAGLSLLIGELKLKASIVSEETRRRLIARHANPQARFGLGPLIRKVAARAGLAMIDVSDGLVRDAARLAEASGVGIELDQRLLPVSPTLARLQRETGECPLPFILHGGEDYELLFTTPLEPAALERARQRLARKGNRPLAPVHRIGRVTRRRGLRLIDANGVAQPLEPAGFEHF